MIGYRLSERTYLRGLLYVLMIFCVFASFVASNRSRPSESTGEADATVQNWERANALADSRYAVLTGTICLAALALTCRFPAQES